MSACLEVTDRELDRLRRQVMSNEEAKALAQKVSALDVLVRSGLCVHSRFYSECNGCRERELRRALDALLDTHDAGFTTPIHGLVPKSEADLWEFARWILNRIDRYERARDDELRKDNQ